jgi:hypothetical protein
MNQQARPAANALPSRAGATPARPSVPARAVPAPQPARGGRPAGPGVPAPRPPLGPRPQPAPIPQPPIPQPPIPQPPIPQRPQAAPAPAPQPVRRPPGLQRPQIAPPLRPLPRPQQPPKPARPYPPGPRASRSAPAPEQVGPPPRPRKTKIGRWVALLVIAGGVGGAVWYGTHAAPTTEGVGDCLAQTGGNQLTKVSCGDKSSRFRVLGKLENKTVVDATLDACSAFPTATSAYWEGETGQRGLVLCLEPVTPAAPAK